MCRGGSARVKTVCAVRPAAIRARFSWLPAAHRLCAAHEWVSLGAAGAHRSAAGGGPGGRRARRARRHHTLHYHAHALGCKLQHITYHVTWYPEEPTKGRPAGPTLLPEFPLHQYQQNGTGRHIWLRVRATFRGNRLGSQETVEDCKRMRVFYVFQIKALVVIFKSNA